MSDSSEKSNLRRVEASIKNVRGRPTGQTNKEGHNAGRKRKQIVYQSFMTKFLTKTPKETVQSEASTSAATNNEQILFGNTEQPQLNTTGIEEDTHNITISLNSEGVEETEDDSNEDGVEETETDSDEEAFEELNDIAKYHEALQQKLGGNNKNKSHPLDECKRGKFWTQTRNPSFVLAKAADPSELYHPRTFIWLPDHLHDNLVCPSCKSGIESKGFDKKTKARRIIDLKDCFYIMTRRYRCKNATKQHFFNGFDSRIIRQLPLRVQADFPALLTHKSGISKDLAKLMRPLFQNSVGPVTLSKILRELHAEHHATVELQYYDAACSEKKSPSIDSLLTKNNVEQKLLPEFSAFSNKELYNGFVPSPGYLSYVYSSIIEQIRPQLDWHMMSLDGNILKGDHSFKVTGHMGKLNGETTFTALYTCLNEYEEIRMQVLTPSKALSHLALPFNAMVQSYNLNGYRLPSLFYTDNVNSDRNFLEGVLPSLLENVDKTIISRSTNNEVDSSSNYGSTYLPVLTLPGTMGISVCSNLEDINNACQIILEDVEKNMYVNIGFDCEWIARNNSSFYSGLRRTPSSLNEVFLIQICYKDKIYLLRTFEYTAEDYPEKLKHLLECENVNVRNVAMIIL
ncbi:hypothetical protein INT47_012017 [Mucor saturninus]|uniref:DUF6729 domain-containing protein n=1 Tax=Mucor saturninus TaxID=64648 RepID=A0A8H7UV57_9FUNG|nr:hypothetical protein INT47_012017 [Mucor saturninus]